MTLSDVLLLLHIAGAGTWLGANIVQAAVPAIARSEGGAFAAGWLRTGAKLGGRLYMPAGIVLLGSGIGLVLASDGAYEFSDLFVTIGFVVIVIGAVLGPAVLTPSGLKAAEALERDDTITAKAASRRVAGFGALDTVLVLFAILVMILRLGS